MAKKISDLKFAKNFIKSNQTTKAPNLHFGLFWPRSRFSGPFLASRSHFQDHIGNSGILAFLGPKTDIFAY